MTDYKTDLNQRYREYQKKRFADGQNYFDPHYAKAGNPPVFLPIEAWRNIIFHPAATRQEKDQLLPFIPPGEKHMWFRSMNSSQVLALSVFGNLAVYGALPALADLKTDEGLALFGKAKISSDNFFMEYKVKYLGEPRPTSLDGFVSGNYRIAIECKFTEAEIGTCSRPLLKPGTSNYEHSNCNGTYSFQWNRVDRCSLSEKGVLYWCYASHLFKWDKNRDYDPCPIYKNFQLVRNVLAAAVTPDGTVSRFDGHALLIYDERNPAFQVNGKGFNSYLEIRNALHNPDLLRKCSWQRIIQHLRGKNILTWLTEELALKYGF
ncbi:MAG: hypothetical protein CVU39_21605 [Chloroflexi bacterium HGW-Chloroflexi-10]|nr:MAG: hypothetical protein CVU39_21605 [Chloroflexi bacterium HGW-Chloroflexi-10]